MYRIIFEKNVHFFISRKDILQKNHNLIRLKIPHFRSQDNTLRGKTVRKEVAKKQPLKKKGKHSSAKYSSVESQYLKKVRLPEAGEGVPTLAVPWTGGTGVEY